MKNLKKELFDFKKNLTFEQDDISQIVEAHFTACGESSEKRIIHSLNERLNPYTYDNDVKGLLEGLNEDSLEHELLYNLKDLYKLVEKRNLGGTIYRQPLNVILNIINLNDDNDRMTKILEELSIYDWVPEIKTFLYNLTKNPEKKENLSSGGNVETVFTIVESVEEGHLAFINDSWFLLKEDIIEKTTLDVHVKDDDKLRKLNTLQSAMKYADIKEDRIDFKISENLVIGISTKEPGLTYINNEETATETTLENLFQSPIIPIVNKNYYPLIMEVASSIDSFVDLDVVKKITNLTNPFVDIYAMNFKDNMYVYRCDSRYSNSFFKYESSMELIDDVRNEMNIDLTYFYEDKLSDEVKTKRKLEDKEREIHVDIEDIDNNIDKVEANIKTMDDSETLTEALKVLKTSRNDKNDELMAVKELKYKEVTQD